MSKRKPDEFDAPADTPGPLEPVPTAPVSRRDPAAAQSFTIVRPCVVGEITYRPGDEAALLAADIHPGKIKWFLLKGAIRGTVPGIAIDEEDRRALFSPPAGG